MENEIKIIEFLKNHPNYKNLSEKYGTDINNIVQLLEDFFEWRNAVILESIPWIKYDFNKSHPLKYGKFIVQLKEGGIKTEIWNGTGWAYNADKIIAWLDINLTK